MAKRKKIRVNTKCVANTYTSPNEAIVEYSFGHAPHGGSFGGLIAFRILENGKLWISVYRHDDGLESVSVGPSDEHHLPVVEQPYPDNVLVTFTKGEEKSE